MTAQLNQQYKPRQRGVREVKLENSLLVNNNVF